MEAFTGYDGKPYCIGDRVELHPSTPARFGRFGVVVGSRTTPNDRVHVVLDGAPAQRFAGGEDTFKATNS